MKSITVSKDVLRQKVEENRAKHRTIFEEALVGYRERLTRELEKHLARVKRGKPERVYISLPYPEDHTRDYDRVLGMIAMDIAESIDLTEQDFAQYVMDDWAWKRQFLTTNSAYSATAADALGEEEDE